MAKQLIWKRLIGQDQIQDTLAHAFNGNTLGHAYLFCGEAGTGTFQAALELAMALLCDAQGPAPCYACESCRKALRHSHPDFHVVVPVSLEKDHRGNDGKLSEEGWAFLSEAVKARIAEPYAQQKYSIVPTIPVEWVKEINHAIMRGPVSGVSTVALIDGIESMNKESANAMLKTLEEPPAGTLIVCMTSRPQAVLPTIASRCQTARFGWIAPEQLRRALEERVGSAVSESIRADAVAFCDGSLGRAIDLCENPPGKFTEEARGLLQACAEADWLRLSTRVDEIVRQADYERYERLLLHMAHLIRGDFLQNIAASKTYFDSVDAAGQTGGAQRRSVAAFSKPDTAGRCMAACRDALSGIRAYGNPSIIMVTFIASLMEIMHE